MQQVPVDPRELKGRDDSGGTFYAAPSPNSSTRLQGLGSRLVYSKQLREITVGVTLAAFVLILAGAGAVGLVVPEARMTPQARARALVAALAVAAVPGTAVRRTSATAFRAVSRWRGRGSPSPRAARSCSRSRARQGKGVVAGTERRRARSDIRATFDGILGGPVAFGRTTHTAVLFRAVSARHRAGSFKPFIGCIPSPTRCPEHDCGPGDRRSAPPLDLAAMTVALTPGLQRIVTISCPTGETLVDSWSATAFTRPQPPPPALAARSRCGRGPSRASGRLAGLRE